VPIDGSLTVPIAFLPQNAQKNIFKSPCAFPVSTAINSCSHQFAVIALEKHAFCQGPETMNLLRRLHNRLLNPKNLLARSQARAGRSTEYGALEPRCLMAGDFVWANQFAGDAAEYGQAITTDNAGSVYTFGRFSGTVDFDPGSGVTSITAKGIQDAFVTKVSSAGSLLWVRTFGGNLEIAPSSIEVDTYGAVYLVGNFTGTADFDPSSGVYSFVATGSAWNGFLSKLDAGGNLLWAAHLGGTGDGLTLSQHGEIFASGNFQGTRDFDPGAGVFSMSAIGKDGYILKLTNSGNLIWAKDFSASLNGLCNVRDIEVDRDGYVYSTGDFEGKVDFDSRSNSSAGITAYNLNDAFVCKLDPAGDFVWAKTARGQFSDVATEIELDSLGRPVIVGQFYGLTDFHPDLPRVELNAVGNDVFVWKLDTDGGFMWVKQIGGANYEWATDLEIDSQGGLYIAGNFERTTDFNPSLASSPLTAYGSTDGYVVKLDPNGEYLWARQLGGTDYDQIEGIALDSRFNILATGSFYGVADMNPRSGTFNLTSRYAADAFTVKLTQNLVHRTVAGASQLTLRKSGTQLQLVNDANGAVLVARPEALYIGAEIRGSSTLSDRLTINAAHGGFPWMPAGVLFNGGAGSGDSLHYIGSGIERLSCTTGQVSGRAVISIGPVVITANEIEEAMVSRVHSLNYITRGSNDVLSVAPVAGLILTASVRVTGTSGSVETVPVSFNQAREVEFDLGYWDRSGVANDSLTFASRGMTATGLAGLSIKTGLGDDLLALNDADLRLPLGGMLQYYPGYGDDQLSVTANANLFLDSLRLTSSAGGEIYHDYVESAVLTGGNGDNFLSAVGFNGWVTLYGNGGNDQLRGTNNNDRIYGGTGDDQIFGGLGNDWLYGEAGADSFYFEGTNNADNLALTRFLSLGVFDRYAAGSDVLLERDNFQFEDIDVVQVSAKEGNDSITIDLAFALFGIVDGGAGDDTCTAPAHWNKISC
jgi:hypothetical protein